MSTILETHQDPNYEPSHSEIVEYGKWLGMEVPADDHLLWIAREGLKAPLPEHWKACKSEKGELYYFNFKSGQSIWDHPLDDHYKKLFKDEKANPSERSRPTAAAAKDAHSSPKPSSHQQQQAQTEQQQPQKKASSRTSSPSTTTNNTHHHGDAAAPAAASAAKSSSSSLPPSGKTKTSAAKDQRATGHALPSLNGGAGGGKGAASSAATNSGSSEDERSSQDGPKLGKLRELKTLKTKKDMPGELRLDALPASTGTSSSSNSSSAMAAKGYSSDPPLTTTAAASWDTKTPLGSTPTTSSISVISGAPEKTITVAGKLPSSASSSTTSLTGLNGRDDAVEISPVSDEIAVGAAASVATTRSNSRESRRRASLVSFSNEEVALAQDGKQLQQLQAENNAELERFRAAENARMQRAKDDHMRILDEGLRSSRDAAGRKHEDAVRSLEGEFKAELQRKKLQLSQQTDDELLRHRRAEEDRMATRLKALKDDVASHVELSIRNLRDAGVDGGNQFLEAVRLEQRAFLSAVANGMDATKRVATEQHAEDVELLKATLQAEKTAIHTRIREIQGECTANISVMKVENAATLVAMAKEFESQKAALEADHKDDIQKLIRDLRATAEAELREIKEEYHRKQQQQHHLLHPLAIDVATVNSSFEDSTTSATTKPLSRFAHPHHQETLVSDLSAQQGLMEAIAAAEHSSSGESASGSLVDLAHSLHAATQTSTPAASSKAAPPPMLSERDLGLSNSTSRTLPPGEDLRSVITEVLRDLFKNSPFILPSPASQNPSVQVSPSNHFGREIEHNVPPLYKGPASPTSTLHSQQQQQQQQPHSSVGRSVPSLNNNGNSPQQQQHNVSHNPPTAQALHQLNTSMAPESYQEQRQLLVDERRRLQEAKAFVENQRTSLEERRAQLKSARRHWKADVMDAKAQGVVATSKKGLLLQKVHKVLDKQAVGLQHDDNLLKDSEHWLKTKEQRLVKLELQFDEHERSRQGTHDMSMASVDTTVLLTGYFKPPLLTQHQPQPEETHPGSVLIAAKAGAAAAASSSAAAAAVHKSHKSSHHTHHVVPSSSTAAPSGTTAAVVGVAVGGVTTTRSISPMLSKALERIEKRLDKVAHLVATTSAVPKQSQHQQQRSSSDATAGRRSGRTSRSNSRGRHVDFAPTTFSDPWVEISPAMA